jgi:hypothetical protein
VFEGGEEVAFALTVDEEGVVRVVGCGTTPLTVTPEQLARLLTAILEVLMTEGGGDEDGRVEVSLN